MLINDKKLTEKSLKISETAFLIVAGMYLACLVIKTTMFSFEIPELLELILHVIMVAVILIRVIAQIKNKQIWFAVVVSVIYNLTWEADIFPILALMTVGCVGIRYCKVLRMYLIAVGSTVIVTIITAMAGGVDNLVYIRDGYIRSSFGINYPTDMASLILFLSITIWVYRKDISNIESIFVSLFSLWIAAYIVRGRTSMICSAIFSVSIVYLLIEDHLIDNNDKLKWIKRVVNILLQAAFPLFAIISWFLLWGYSKGYTFGVVANNLLSYRLTWALRALKENGISAFGKPFNQTGAGSTTFETLDYFYVDSSYHRILLMYGILIFILMCILWVLITRRAIGAGDRRLALALAVIAFHAISEQHFIQPFYNIFIVLPFSVLDQETKKVYEKENVFSLHRIMRIVTAMAALLFFRLLLPWLRVNVEHCKYQLFNLVCVLIFLIVLLWFTYGVGRIIEGKIKKEIIKRTDKYIVFISAFFFAAVLLWFNNSIKVYANEYNDIIEREREAVQTIISSTTGNVYVDKLGELYRRKYGKISRSVFDGEDLARFDKTTVIVDEELDSLVFKKRGFLYSKISDEHAVYTNDEAVINALNAKGYRTTGYCTAVHKIDPKKKDDLYFGQYSFKCNLEIEPETFDSDYIVCNVLITAFDQSKVLRNFDIYRSWFDKNGKLNADILFKTGNYPNVMFRITPARGQDVFIKDMTWQRSPAYDVHSTYDDSRRKIKDSYFDENGNPTMTDKGYATVMYSYNELGKCDKEIYYDVNGDLVNNSSGYAKMVRTYNIMNRKIREEYYDDTDSRVINSDGYAIREWEYDVNGNVSRTSFLGIDEEPIMTVYGYSSAVREYNEKNSLVYDKYFGTDGKRIMTQYGYAGTYRTFDEEGKYDKTFFIDENDEPVVNAAGYAGVRRVYDIYGKLLSDNFYDLDGEPLMIPEGYAEVDYMYDMAGNVWNYRFYDEDGNQLMLNSVKVPDIERVRDLIRDDADTSDLDGFDPEEK